MMTLDREMTLSTLTASLTTYFAQLAGNFYDDDDDDNIDNYM